MESNYLTEFLTIMAVSLFALASPGPDFAMVLRQSVSYGRSTALWTSLGVGCGVLIHVAYCLLGLGLIIAHSLVAFRVLKWAGALYLIAIGIQSLRSASRRPTDLSIYRPVQVPSRYQALWIGFCTNVLNPKATLFFLSVYSAVISAQTPLLLQAGYGLYMALATIVWYVSLSLLLGHPFVRRWIGAFGHWGERFVGIALIGLGLKLATTSTR